MAYNHHWHDAQENFPTSRRDFNQQNSFQSRPYEVVRNQPYGTENFQTNRIPPNHSYKNPFVNHGEYSPCQVQHDPGFQEQPTYLQQHRTPQLEQQPQFLYGKGSEADSRMGNIPGDATPRGQGRSLHTAPPPYLSRPFLPIAIPQMSKGRGVPFQRLYAPLLQEYGITEREFVDFIDTLNVVSAASPPFKVIDLASGVIGMVPHHWAQLTSNALKLVAIGGTRLVCKSRTDAFLQDENQKILGPRGLRVRLVTTDALLASVKFPQHKALTLPLDAKIPLDQQPAFHTRLLQGLRGYVSETVPTNLQPTQITESRLDKLSADQVSRDLRNLDKKMMKESEKQMKNERKKKHHSTSDLVHEDENQASSRRPARSKSVERKLCKIEHAVEKVNKEIEKDLSSGKHSVARIEREREEKLSSLEKKRERLLEKSERKRDKSDSDSDRHRDHEKKSVDDKLAKKLLWIFIEQLPTEGTFDMSDY